MDVRYPGMDPVTCLELVYSPTPSKSIPSVCFLDINGGFGVPFFHHAGLAGSSQAFPKYVPKMCDCADGSGLLAPCNVFDFISGVILFPTGLGSTNASSLASILQLAYANTANARLFGSALFNATFIAQAYISTRYQSTSFSPADSAHYAQLLSPITRANAYSFCGANNCTIVSVNSVDTRNTAINPYYFQVPQGSCRDTFSISSASL
jgi:hypothetical protein